MIPESVLSLQPRLTLGQVAQSVEQRTENPCVAGSIPALTTSKGCRKTAFFVFFVFVENRKNSDFFDQVYQVVRLIPSGRVTSYGAIAAYLGSARSSRMVGWAMNASHFSAPDIPAHRVVNRNGLLTGKHFFGGDSMAERLRSEGVEVVEDKIINFNQVFWDPSQELSFH